MPFLGIIFGFIKGPFGKIIGGGLLIAIVLGIAVHKWNNYREILLIQGRNEGKAQQIQIFKQQVTNNNKVNRMVEQLVDRGLTHFSAGLDTRLEKLHRDEAVMGRLVNDQIRSNPQLFDNRTCDTPQETIDARNAIRHLGPAAPEPVIK